MNIADKPKNKIIEYYTRDFAKFDENNFNDKLLTDRR